MVSIVSISENRYSCACSCNDKIYIFNPSNSSLFIAEDTITDINIYTYNSQRTGIEQNYEQLFAVEGYVHSACSVDEQHILIIREVSIKGTRATQFICSKFNILTNICCDLSPFPRAVSRIARISNDLFYAWNGSYQFISIDGGNFWKSTIYSYKEYALVSTTSDTIYILRKNKIFTITTDMILHNNLNEKLILEFDFDAVYIQFSKENEILYIFYYKNGILYMKDAFKSEKEFILYKNAKSSSPDVANAIISGDVITYTILDQSKPFSSLIALIKANTKEINIIEVFKTSPVLLHSDASFALYGSVFPDNSDEFYLFSLNTL